MWTCEHHLKCQNNHQHDCGHPRKEEEEEENNHVKLNNKIQTVYSGRDVQKWTDVPVEIRQLQLHDG